jgi:integrase
MENYQHQANYRTKKIYFNNFKSYFGEDKLLLNIRYVDVETYRNHLKQKFTQHGTIRTDSSVNREMSCLRHMLKKAFEWELIEQSPFYRGKSLILKENNKRLRFLNEDEITRLLDECPEYLRNIVECAINTGMRKGEILSLKWNQVRNGFIYLRETKTKESLQIPVNDDLEVMFKQVRKEQHLTSEHIFIYKGNAITDGVKTAFNAALMRAGIEDFKFHDLRHTFASQVLLRGGDLKDIQELLGHKTMTMTLRYAHLTQEHKKKAVNLLNGLTAFNKKSKNDECHKTVTFPNQEKCAIG